jgi:hypothetical protein
MQRPWLADLVLFSLGLSSAAGRAANGSWVSLFDGKSLAG